MDDRSAEQMARGDRAKVLLEDPMIATALADMRATLRTAWESSPARDVEGREELYRYMRTIENFESCLRRHMETGEIARHHMRVEEERKSIMARAMEKVGIR